MSTPAAETASTDAEQASLQDLINAKLVASGERERLKQLLRDRLIECGWRDELKEQCKRIVKERGFENITTDELAKEITPVGRATVPVRTNTRSRAAYTHARAPSLPIL
jgi:enhancer of yellow 2 transcription factor